ncbi:alanine racemase [Subtercola vilae]|uniref:Alanine racemase n=1 Tax=Subtercola vilae TaxID=2056433 RepID=A0A4T2C734_9MICO|nr:alanine racemase [Subtercola vilae]TIH39412.1 alanine racemase [Subtercola vilae]
MTTAVPLRLATIDLGAIAHNVKTIATAVGGADVMAVVKANGYGHGAVEVARAALDAGATWLGVADLDEAVELRDAGLTAPVLAWLHGPQADFEVAVRRGIDVGVSSVAQLAAVAAAVAVADSEAATAPSLGEATRARVHLKVDTGLGRNGADESHWRALFSRAAELQRTSRIDVVGFFSHLSNANDAEDLAQLGRFERALAEAREAGLAPTVIHLASTAAALTLPTTRFSLVRIGIGMYGLSPFDGVTSGELGLRPAMTLEGRVISVKRAAPGSGVSYGYTYRTEGAATLALVALGYADGIARLGSNRAPVSINGGRFRVSGRIAMDQFVVDVGDTAVAVGDRVVLFGDAGAGHPSADDWAESAETINYEIVTRIGRRIERRYVS